MLQSQLREVIKPCKTYSAATTKLFRKIFSKEEVAGRSLRGLPSKGKVRPALERQDKVDVIRGKNNLPWKNTCI